MYSCCLLLVTFVSFLLFFLFVVVFVVFVVFVVVVVVVGAVVTCTRVLCVGRGGEHADGGWRVVDFVVRCLLMLG